VLGVVLGEGGNDVLEDGGVALLDSVDRVVKLGNQNANLPVRLFDLRLQWVCGSSL
jgi:hypothetical protein